MYELMTLRNEQLVQAKNDRLESLCRELSAFQGEGITHDLASRIADYMPSKLDKRIDWLVNEVSRLTDHHRVLNKQLDRAAEGLQSSVEG